MSELVALREPRRLAGRGFSRIDILDDGEIVETFVPLTGRDEILYEVEPHAA